MAMAFDRLRKDLNRDNITPQLSNRFEAIHDELGFVRSHRSSARRDDATIDAVTATRTFGERGHLAQRVRTVHEGDRRFRCDRSGKRFSSSSDMRRHVQVCHLGVDDVVVAGSLPMAL